MQLILKSKINSLHCVTVARIIFVLSRDSLTVPLFNLFLFLLFLYSCLLSNNIHFQTHIAIILPRPDF